ncbi:UDP-N-acetylmuramoyl-tripeptide--D-alanyl-D-alanine ligase [Candidatus Saccharibacteria bacterium]|nr:UDP-N-acetylmuramoyl-tripeptide--D-alanyl-D-alanine ligase [Candidatus Saccharibacteria bacterium]
MIKKYWSRLNFGYERTLLYMLQQTEYNVREYLSWLRRVKNFRIVRKRGEMVPTMKIHLLFNALALFVLIYIAAIFWAVIAFNQLWIYGLALALLLILPVIAQYVIVLPLIFGDFLIKKPLAKKRIALAKEILKDHKGYRIAIAGSFGKTTAKSVLATILAGGKKVAATPGNINQPLGFAKFIDRLTGDEDILIFEFGEYRPDDIMEMCNFIQPDAGFITGINDAHLANFSSRDELVSDIMDLQKYLADKPIYLNADSEILKKFDTKNSTFYSRDGVKNLPVKNVTVTAFGTELTLGKMKIESGLLGRHNIGIVAAAVDFAKKLGLDEKEIRAGLKDLKPFEHRMEPRILNGAVVIDDTYNGNLDGVRAGIGLLKELPAKRKIYVTPGLVEQGSKVEENHREIGELLAKANFDKVVLMKNSVTKSIVEGLGEKYHGELTIIYDPLTFYLNLDTFVATGDVVLMQNDWTDNYA